MKISIKNATLVKLLQQSGGMRWELMHNAAGIENEKKMNNNIVVTQAQKRASIQ